MDSVSKQHQRNHVEILKVESTSGYPHQIDVSVSTWIRL